ncbi:MAG: hypothetical protein H6816_14455 [Phycisphaerales bacterium]|nr:hypothetical protein [Phycisphaerales bacterium]
MNAYKLIEALQHRKIPVACQAINDFIKVLAKRKDLGALRPLLRHDDPDVVEIGVGIADELADDRCGRSILDDVAALIGHPEVRVRMHAISILARLVTPQDHPLLESLLSCLRDDDVWQWTLSRVFTMHPLLFAEMRESRNWPAIQLLMAETEKEKLKSVMQSRDAFTRRLAAAGAVLNHEGDGAFIREILAVLDKDLREIVEQWHTSREALDARREALYDRFEMRIRPQFHPRSRRQQRESANGDFSY